MGLISSPVWWGAGAEGWEEEVRVVLSPAPSTWVWGRHSALWPQPQLGAFSSPAAGSNNAISQVGN